MRHRSSVWALSAVLGALAPVAAGQEWITRDVNFQVGGGLRAVRLRERVDAMPAARSAGALGTADEAPVPINGPTPWVAIVLTDAARHGEFEWEHQLSEPTGATPLSSGYAIGVLDTGGTTHVIGSADRTPLGLTPAWLTGNTADVVGANGEPVAVDVGRAMGVRVAGLQAIDPATNALDMGATRGHWNVSALVAPDDCPDAVVPSIIGTPLLAFTDIVIHNDRMRTVFANGVEYTGPEVEVLPKGTAPAVPNAKTVVLDMRPGTVRTSLFLSNILEGDFETPWLPTALAEPESIPTGGWFFASVHLQEGGSSELLRDFIVDTGAQVCVVRTFLAGQLGLDLNNPEFEVDVLGVACDITTVPGFYIDTFKIDASGGPIELHQVPVVVLNPPSLLTSPTEGIIGMNVFHNRNLTLRPDISFGGASFLDLSQPFSSSQPVYGDFDNDGDVDLTDFQFLLACFNGPQRPPTLAVCGPTDSDGDSDVDLVDFSVFLTCFNGPSRPPGDGCPPAP